MGDCAVSVVICAYTEERWDDLLAAVHSVQRQTVPALEIIVVVDHNPLLMERVRAQVLGAVVVPNAEPPGLGGARNSGLAAAQGDIIAFLDDDALAASDWLEQLLLPYADSGVMAVGGAIDAAWDGGRPGWFPEEFEWAVGCSYRGLPTAPGPVRNVHGCNMSFRRQVFEAIGGFRLGYGCDETELCIRLQSRWGGGSVIYQPTARVLHRVPATRAKWRYFFSRCYFEGGSKAVVSWLVGSTDALASERAYTLRTLPEGMLRGIVSALFRGDVTGLARVGAILAGLIATVAGYVRGRLAISEAAQRRGWRAAVGEPTSR